MIRAGSTIRSGGRTTVRLAVFAVAIAAVALLLGTVFLSQASAVSYETQELEVVRLINEYRQDLGLRPLMVSDLCSDAAEKHDSDMAKYGFVGHETIQSDFFPVGANAGTRLAMCGYFSGQGWAEIIGAGQRLATTVFDGWKASPNHNSYMIDTRYQVMGVSQVYDPGSQYGYYWTVTFGVFVDSTAHWTTDPPTTTTTTAAPPTTTTTTTGPSPSTTTTTLPSTTTTTTSTTTTTTSAVAFTDVKPGHLYYEAITSLASLGVLCGSSGLFNPDGLVTRAQFAKIIVLALGFHTAAIDNAGAPSFKDVPYVGAVYPFDFVEEAVALQIVRGRDDGTFGPSDPVTRAQLALMLVRAGGDGLRTPPPEFPFLFTDVPGYAHDAVAIAKFNGLLDGKSATFFGSSGNATRGQVAKMVYNLVGALAE